jgi:hypothetical protein
VAGARVDPRRCARTVELTTDQIRSAHGCDHRGQRRSGAPERTNSQETVEAVEMAPERQTYQVNAGKLAALVVAGLTPAGRRS